MRFPTENFQDLNTSVPPQEDQWNYYLRPRDGAVLFQIPEGECRIGKRAGLQNYLTPCRNVAREQAELLKKNNSIYIRDIFRHPRAPITINGKLVGEEFTPLHEKDSLMISGYQFDILHILPWEEKLHDRTTEKIAHRVPALEYEGFYTHTIGASRFVLRTAGQDKIECVASSAGLLRRNKMVEAGKYRLSFHFPGDDEPTIVPGLRGYFVDHGTRQPVASVEYRVILRDPAEYILRVENNEIWIKSYLDGSFHFYCGNEEVARFKRHYDPERKFASYGANFPMDYYAWCLESVSELARILILSIPLIGQFGVSPDYRLEELRKL